MEFNRLTGWIRGRIVYVVLAIIVLAALIGGYVAFIKNKGAETASEVQQKQVKVERAADLEKESVTLPSVGQVRAVSEADLQTEAGGRVTAVNVAIGDHVAAGQVLASLENSRERASLLQAEGAYEAAQSGNAQATIGLDEATVAAKNAYRSAYTSSDSAIRNLADELFANPTGNVPGLKLDAGGDAQRLGNERIALGDVLESWSQKVSAGSGDPLQNLDEAERDLKRINAFLGDLSLDLSKQDPNPGFTTETLISYKSRFLAARSSIDGAISAVAGAKSQLLTAQQSASGLIVKSDSDARIKQAYGALQLAQAAYEKTLVRTPISGTVNALYLTANQYVGSNVPAAVVANNGALEITTSVGEDERALVAIGNSVTINDTFKGSVTRIAPAVDPLTNKIEVKIGVNDDAAKSLINGTTVSLSIEGVSPEATTSEELRLPLEAVKITPQGPVVFKVGDDHTLSSIKVTLGSILGDVVAIESGLSRDEMIVIDARGLKEGETVEVTN